MVLGQFRDNFITDNFVTLLLKSGLRFDLGPSEMDFFKDILFFLCSFCIHSWLISVVDSKELCPVEPVPVNQSKYKKI